MGYYTPVKEELERQQNFSDFLFNNRISATLESGVRLESI